MFKKLNEELEKFLEISDETKASYLAKRQAQADKANAKLAKAKDLIKKADEREINSLSNEATKDEANSLFVDLKRLLTQISSGVWRTQEEDGYLTLEVRHWGDWELPAGKEDEEDYDWEELSEESFKKLMEIVKEIAKKYGIKPDVEVGEKNWIIFSIKLVEEILSPEEELLQELANHGTTDVTTSRQKQKDIIMLDVKATKRGYRIMPTENGQFQAFILNNFGTGTDNAYRYGKQLCVGTKEECLQTILSNSIEHQTRMMGRK